MDITHDSAPTQAQGGKRWGTGSILSLNDNGTNGNSSNGSANGSTTQLAAPAPTTTPAPKTAAPAVIADLITNYSITRLENGQSQRTALTLREITSAIYRLTSGWPRRVGSRLFVDPGHPRPIRWLDDVDDLFAWLHTVAPAPGIGWGGSDDDFGATLITRRELFAHLRATATAYDAAESLPYWPPVPSIYCSWPEVPDAEIQAGVSDADLRAAVALLDDFLSAFNPATIVDHALMYALFLTPFWGGECGRRPLFIVTTSDETSQQIEQEAGKTTLVEKLAAVAGGTFDATEDDRNRNGDDIAKRILSPIALARRVMLIDNSRGVLNDPRLAKILTQDSISGRPAYAQQASRPNRLTWAVTTNNTDLDTDLARRCVVLRIKHPDKLDPTWEPKIDRFIAARRTDLINAAITILRARPTAATPASTGDGSENAGESENGSSVPASAAVGTRFPTWDHQVLGCHHAAAEALIHRADDITAVNIESEDCALFINELRRRFAGQPLVELEPVAVSDAWNTALCTRSDLRWTMRRIKHHIRKGRLPMLKLKWPKKHGSPLLLNLGIIGES